MSSQARQLQRDEEISDRRMSRALAVLVVLAWVGWVLQCITAWVAQRSIWSYDLTRSLTIGTLVISTVWFIYELGQRRKIVFPLISFVLALIALGLFI